MAKKLLTKDATLVAEVENVLKKNNVPCVRVHRTDGQYLLAVTNKNGPSLYEAVNSVKTKSKYYIGVLRGHPEYSIPRGILKELAEEEFNLRTGK